MRDLKDKTAFITGGGNGFGLALAGMLVEGGARVMLADISADALAAAADGLRRAGGEVETVLCDVTRPDELVAAAEKTQAAFGPVHLLFNNAGVVVAGDVVAMKASDWRWLFGVNVLGVANGLAAFLPAMRAHGEPARIVNTASEAAFGGVPGAAAYCASKAAVLSISESLRAELSGTNVGVSVLCPGWMRTGFFDAGNRRQDEFGGPSEMWSVAGEHTKSALLAGIEAGDDPHSVARIVLRGLADDRFLIVTRKDDASGRPTRADEQREANRWLQETIGSPARVGATA